MAFSPYRPRLIMSTQYSQAQYQGHPSSSGRLFFSLAALTLSMSFPAAACRAAELGTLSSGPLGA